MAEGTRKEYTAEGIAVSFDSALCIHTAACLRGLPDVFDVNRRPWIQPENASPDEIIEVVNRCPSGALQWRIPGEERPDPLREQELRIRASRNGPLQVRGNFTLLDGEGEELHESTRLSLCRCGLSENKPFCDNSHQRAGWQATNTSGTG
ncbi:MAG: (4Fe-4S)-binding protein [Dehalococcoidia bacterium]|nr:(4Fe-4S)-binding protein [Dehalococcoidia bacterium]